MKGAIGGLTLAALVLAGCGASVLNPLNWFGRSAPSAGSTEAENPLIPRRTNNLLLGNRNEYMGDNIARLTDLTIERLPGAAIIRATGVSDRNGPYDARLTPVDDGDPTTLIYDFDVVTPSQARSTETERVRTVVVATRVSDRALRGVRVIEVRARTNARSSTRR